MKQSKPKRKAKKPRRVVLITITHDWPARYYMTYVGALERIGVKPTKIRIEYPR